MINRMVDSTELIKIEQQHLQVVFAKNSEILRLTEELAEAKKTIDALSIELDCAKSLSKATAVEVKDGSDRVTRGKVDTVGSKN
jgi:hypothetical protein